VALIAGGIAFWRDPAHVAASGVVVAAFSAVPFAVVALGLILSQPRRIVAQRVSAFALSGVLVLGLFAVGPMQTAQAQAYADHGAYAQAVAYLQHVHAPVTQQAQVYREWAQAAIAANDFPTAIAEWQTALTIDGAADVTPDCTHWLSTIVQWNTLLTKAHQFTNATQMLTAQRDFPHCAEQQPINVQLSTDHLAWGNFAYLSGDDVTAFIQFQIVSQQDVQTKDAAQANLALPEVVAHQQLMQALASDITGGDAAMTAKLQALMQRYPHTAAAREAVETPESVTGVLGDPARVAGEQIFFFAFATRAQAAAFGSSASTSDTSLFKFSGVCAPNGSFTVHVTPGYWYLPAWGDPSQDANYYVPFDAASAVFTVQPLTPAAIGVVG